MKQYLVFPSILLGFLLNPTPSGAQVDPNRYSLPHSGITWDGKTAHFAGSSNYSFDKKSQTYAPTSQGYKTGYMQGGSWGKDADSQYFSSVTVYGSGQIQVHKVSLYGNDSKLKSITNCQGQRNFETKNNDVVCATSTRASCDAVIKVLNEQVKAQNTHVAFDQRKDAAALTQEMAKKTAQCQDVMNYYKPFAAELKKRMAENGALYDSVVDDDVLQVKKDLDRTLAKVGGFGTSLAFGNSKITPTYATGSKLFQSWDSIVETSLPRNISTMQAMNKMIENCYQYRNDFRGNSIGNKTPSMGAVDGVE